jgi:hypothetical protein
MPIKLIDQAGLGGNQQSFFLGLKKCQVMSPNFDFPSTKKKKKTI